MSIATVSESTESSTSDNLMTEGSPQTTQLLHSELASKDDVSIASIVGGVTGLTVLLIPVIIIIILLVCVLLKQRHKVSSFNQLTESISYQKYPKEDQAVFLAENVSYGYNQGTNTYVMGLYSW